METTTQSYRCNHALGGKPETQKVKHRIASCEMDGREGVHGVNKAMSDHLVSHDHQLG